METKSTDIIHVLPGEENGDIKWFFRQNEFEQQEIKRQVEFKKKNWPELGSGRFRKLPNHIYPHILPDQEDILKKAFWSPISDHIIEYFSSSNIAIHTEALNLKSSQVACLNFLFPLKQDLGLATVVFQKSFSDLEKVTNIEFEYTGPEEATLWLGEPSSGVRGQNRTSIDAAIFWKDQNGEKHISLIEWKYTERSFGSCRAFEKDAPEDRARCLELNVGTDMNPAISCALCSGKRHRQRKYWEHMADAGIDLKSFARVTGCPFRGPFYQLMRQHILAQYLRISGLAQQTEVISMGFQGNHDIQKLPQYLQPLLPDGDVLDAWNYILKDVPSMRQIYIEELMETYEKSMYMNQNWRSYILERYGV